MKSSSRHREAKLYIRIIFLMLFRTFPETSNKLDKMIHEVLNFFWEPKEGFAYNMVFRGGKYRNTVQLISVSVFQRSLNSLSVSFFRNSLDTQLRTWSSLHIESEREPKTGPCETRVSLYMNISSLYANSDPLWKHDNIDPKRISLINVNITTNTISTENNC